MNRQKSVFTRVHRFKGGRLTAVLLFLLLFGLVMGGGAETAVAQQPVTPLYSQNFDGIGTSATATVPTNWRVDNPSTARTVGTWGAASTATTYRGGNGTISANGIYNFGAGDAATATDRAIGWLSSSGGTRSGNLYLQMTNNTGISLNSVSVSYDVEKYRQGSNANGFRIQLYYSADGVNWTDAGTTFLTSFPADANNNGYASAPGVVVPVVGVLNFATPIDPDEIFYLAWNYSVASGTTYTNAQALAVDNVVITPPTYQTITLDGTVNNNEWGSGILGEASSTTFAMTWDENFLYIGARGGLNAPDSFFIGIDTDPTNHTTNSGGSNTSTANLSCGNMTFPAENKPDYVVRVRQGGGDGYVRQGWSWNGTIWESRGGVGGSGFGDAAWQNSTNFDFAGTPDYEVKIAKSLIGIADNGAPVGIYLWLVNSSCEFFNAWPPENPNGYLSGTFLFAHTLFASTDTGRFPNAYGARVAWAAHTLSADGTAYNFFGDDDAPTNPWLRMTTTASGAGGPSCTVRAKLVGNNAFSNPPFIGINRYVDFTLTNCTGLEVDVQMRYETTELNGINEDDGTFYRCASLPCSASWTPVVANGGYISNLQDNHLILEAVPQTQFSFWTISDDQIPTAVSLSTFSAANTSLPLLLLVVIGLLLGGTAVVRRKRNN